MILAIDPSISNLGYAVGSIDGEIEEYGHLRTYSRWQLERRVQKIHSKIQELIDDWQVDLIIYEMPESFRYGHKTRGIETFLKMGMSFGAFLSIEDMQFKQVTPREWKGNTKKEETAMLVKGKYDIESNDDNEIDAIGIFDYYVRFGDNNE